MPVGRDPLAQLLARPRYEVFPAEGIEQEVAEHVPTSVKLTVTSSPARGLEATWRDGAARELGSGCPAPLGETR